MKLNILTHNVKGLNDHDKDMRERGFLISLIPKVDEVVIQEHTLRSRMLHNLGIKLMIKVSSWILKATPREHIWLILTQFEEVEYGLS